MIRDAEELRLRATWALEALEYLVDMLPDGELIPARPFGALLSLTLDAVREAGAAPS
jgi:hypothetical protein